MLYTALAFSTALLITTVHYFYSLHVLLTYTTICLILGSSLARWAPCVLLLVLCFHWHVQLGLSICASTALYILLS